MSELAERATSAGQTHSMELIFFPLFILIFIGIIANNYQAVGIQTTPTLINPCQSLAICYPTNTNGCDNAVSNCNLTSSTSFSFLDSNSPFTLLIQGDVLGFLGYLFNSHTGTPSSNIGSINNCSPIPTGQGKDNIFVFECGSISWLNQNAFVNGQPPIVAFTSKTNDFYCKTYNANCFNVRTQNLPFKPSTLNGFSFFGLALTGANSNKNCSSPGSGFSSGSGNGSLIFATYTVYGNTTNLKVGSPGFGSGTNTTSTFLVYMDYCDGANPNTKSFSVVQFVESSPNISNQSAFFGFFAGIILLVLGLGLTFAGQVAGTGVTIGSNDQVTRFCEVIGVGLVVWSFVFSEFGSWLTNLPFNLNIIGIITFTTLFFLGLYWRIFTLD